jgi:hypothetical protein
MPLLSGSEISAHCEEKARWLAHPGIALIWAIMRVYQDEFLHGTRDCHKAAPSLFFHRARVASFFRFDSPG